MSNSIRHSACVISSEYVTRTSLYLDRLKIFEWMKFLKRHLHQILGNRAGRNFLTASRVNSQLITHARMQRWIWATSTNRFNFGIINSLMESWGVCLTWLDCKTSNINKWEITTLKIQRLFMRGFRFLSQSSLCNDPPEKQVFSSRPFHSWPRPSAEDTRPKPK